MNSSSPLTLPTKPPSSFSLNTNTKLSARNQASPVSCSDPYKKLSPFKYNYIPKLLRTRRRNRASHVFCSAVAELPLETAGAGVVDYKVGRIVSEFKSLLEPIDRVKRLLDYAAVLPEFDESERVRVNKVNGCSVQVWLCVGMDEFGRMRFSADSDSEITKGFCSCLVWILDGAYPDEVIGLKTEDLSALNVGLHGRSHSRVNTWHNVLISMQKRTKLLVLEEEKRRFW
ncbi:hypothetical protein GIB67_004442 [Kingdonia uniflora]|uniref:Fe-S metabolism associated domain-containing protein n=1 Tax=Kingdonia uniflora TaxID=39325 RepID=A0A7J7MRM5_9MAGN|nr:hypothetical protein GIB67_004442 [Kingdonia uniflora]